MASVFDDCKQEMEQTVGAFKRELTRLRTSRASTALLDGIVVEYYGARTPLNQLSSITAPESRLLVIQPFDRSAIGEIERAIFQSDLGLTPVNDGKIIRIPIPPLNEERRKELAKKLHGVAEDHRVAIRNVRRDANDAIKKLAKDKKIAEDEDRRGHDETQKLTDGHMAKLDQLARNKEKEIMEIK